MNKKLTFEEYTTKKLKHEYNSYSERWDKEEPIRKEREKQIREREAFLKSVESWLTRDELLKELDKHFGMRTKRNGVNVSRFKLYVSSPNINSHELVFKTSSFKGIRRSRILTSNKHFVNIAPDNCYEEYKYNPHTIIEGVAEVFANVR